MVQDFLWSPLNSITCPKEGIQGTLVVTAAR